MVLFPIRLGGRFLDWRRAAIHLNTCWTLGPITNAAFPFSVAARQTVTSSAVADPRRL